MTDWIKERGYGIAFSSITMLNLVGSSIVIHDTLSSSTPELTDEQKLHYGVLRSTGIILLVITILFSILILFFGDSRPDLKTYIYLTYYGLLTAVSALMIHATTFISTGNATAIKGIISTTLSLDIIMIGILLYSVYKTRDDIKIQQKSARTDITGLGI